MLSFNICAATIESDTRVVGNCPQATQNWTRTESMGGPFEEVRPKWY